MQCKHERKIHESMARATAGHDRSLSFTRVTCNDCREIITFKYSGVDKILERYGLAMDVETAALMLCEVVLGPSQKSP